MSLYHNIIDTIGNTPIIELKNIEKEYGLCCHVFAKLDSFNPGGSAKDRIAKAMIIDAEEKGLINKDTLIVEPTSGNTGIGLAMVCASRGYKLVLTMPETMSIERRKILAAYGANLVLTEGKLGMKGAIAKAEEILKENKNSFMPSQFNNMANPIAHYMTTGKEIYKDLDGNVDVFIAGVGTGGTVSGVGRYLKENKKSVKVIAVEPSGSPMISKGEAGPHKIQGIGAGFIPNTLDRSVIDEVITVTNEEAMENARMIAKKEGILVGISSGAALTALLKVASRKESEGKNLVVMLVDTGERYLSSELFTPVNQ